LNTAIEVKTHGGELINVEVQGLSAELVDQFITSSDWEPVTFADDLLTWAEVQSLSSVYVSKNLVSLLECSESKEEDSCGEETRSGSFSSSSEELSDEDSMDDSSICNPDWEDYKQVLETVEDLLLLSKEQAINSGENVVISPEEKQEDEIYIIWE